MIKVAHKIEREDILERIREGKIDGAPLSTSSLVDEIILSMKKNEIISCLNKAFPDKRADNAVVPFDLLFALAIAAKMRVHTSLTDIPFALTDHRTLAELGYSLRDTDRDMGKSLMTEGAIRALVGKYTADEFLAGYNAFVQSQICPKMDLVPNIHILDCTKIEVNMKNNNYENAGIGVDSDGKAAKGYKLSTLRGIVNDTGIIEDIRFGQIQDHDLALSREMILTSPCLKPGDILINDRGFISREVMNELKTSRAVDTYIPLKENMQAKEMAVSCAKLENNWEPHPNRKRESQKIAFVTNLGEHWQSDCPEEDVDFNACVVWDQEADEHFVFVTTDLSKSAAQIIKTYELRPEIEEDYRQLKDFWKIEDFKSTKYNFIMFHIVFVLIGYLFFQLYTMLPGGEQWARKSLPIVLKSYQPKAQGYVVVYSGDCFGVLSLVELMDIYADCSKGVRSVIAGFLESNS